MIRLALWKLGIGIILISPGHTETKTAHHCAAYVAHYEKNHAIPNGLLGAISKVESGRRDPTGHIAAWPWTVNAAGKGYHFPTKHAAIAAVKKLQAKGIKSIDVGCMQINLYYHPHAFKNLEDAFDPAKNVEYAALFLTRLKREHTSWSAAVSRYHSANPVHHIPYRQNVLAAWMKDRKQRGVTLASGVLSNAPLSSSKPNRLRRLSMKRGTKAQAASSRATLTPTAVRKITRSSRHLRRISYRPSSSNDDES